MKKITSLEGMWDNFNNTEKRVFTFLEVYPYLNDWIKVIEKVMPNAKINKEWLALEPAEALIECVSPKGKYHHDFQDMVGLINYAIKNENRLQKEM